MLLCMGSHGHRECVTNAAQGEAKLTSAVVASLVPFVLGIQLAKLSSRCLPSSHVMIFFCFMHNLLKQQELVCGTSSMFSWV